MVQRDDVTIDWFLSPRIIRIAEPSTEIDVQDLHDTVTEIESRITNLIYDRIIATAGKENLGSGVFVGLTSTLLNAKLAFEARKISTVSGTVTTADTDGRLLFDAGANFSTVEQGAWVVNLTDDGSCCSVVDVIDNTTILTDFLADGYDNQFEIGDSYKIWNVEQVNVSGGNVVAVDGYNNAISPILPSMGTQVVRTSAASATLRELADIQFSSFIGGVTYDAVNGVSGTTFPTGTPRQPVNNFTDALTILNSRGLVNIYVFGTAVINSGLDFRNVVFIGDGTQANVTVNSAAQVDGCKFMGLEMQGTLDGYVDIEDCIVNDITYVDGIIRKCNMRGTVTLSGSRTVTMINCFDGIAGFGTPTIDCNSAGTNIVIRGYRGGLLIINKDGPEEVSIDMDSARLVLDSTITAGDIIVRGVGHLTNNTTGTTTVDSSNVVNPGTTSSAALKKILPFLDD